MDEKELIVKISLENAELKEKVSEYVENFESIRMRLVCIGGPFNDNKLQFSKAQLTYLKPILDIVDD